LAATGIQLPDSAIQALLNLVAIALERVITEAAANKAEIARQNEEFKSMLLDAIAHEFKTPLTSIKAAATSLLDETDVLRADQREMASIIDEETDRLSLLVTEAVKMSQIDAGKVKLDRQITAPATILETAAASFSGRGDHRIEYAAPHGARTVFVDAELITLALRQLIDNALKYSPLAGTIAITAQPETDRVVLRVTDQGPGIPERDRERIFDKYFRRANVRDIVPGSGLGLHITREIARAHGGDVWVEPSPEGGSSFCIALPCQEAPQS
jgi:two-component system sensor histidine kinase KdpD